MQNCQPNGSYMYTKRNVYVYQGNIYIYAWCTYRLSFVYIYQLVWLTVSYTLFWRKKRKIRIPDKCNNTATGRLNIRDRELNELYVKEVKHKIY